MISDAILEVARQIDIVEVIAGHVDLKKQGAEHVALCPFHEESTPSFKVNGAKGIFKCFGCGEGGDAISFLMKFLGLEFAEAVQRLANRTSNGQSESKPLTRPIQPPSEEWVPILPVPEDAPKPPVTAHFYQKGGKWREVVADGMWAYRDLDGNIMGYVQRFNVLGQGGEPSVKEIRPLTFRQNSVTGERSWRRKHLPVPHPLYGLEKLMLHKDAQVLVVEGEKACDAAQKLLIASGIEMDRVIVLSWLGGVNGVGKVDFSPLEGRKVGLWPDADQKRYLPSHPLAGNLLPFLDQPGTRAMLDLYECIRGQCPVVKFILPPVDVPDGWDLADEPPKQFDLKIHMKSRAMNASDVKTRFSLTSSLKQGDGILPVWLVPPTSSKDLQRAAFAADLISMYQVGASHKLDPRGVLLRPYDDIDGLGATIVEINRLMPNAKVHVIIPQALAHQASELSCSKQILPTGASWVDELWAAVTQHTGVVELSEPLIEVNEQPFVADASMTKSCAAHALEFESEPVTSAVSVGAQKVAKDIESKLAKAFGFEPQASDNREQIDAFGIDVEVIERMLSGAFWSGGKGKLFFLNGDEALNQFTAGDAYKFLVRAFGSPVDAKVLEIATDAAAMGAGMTKADEKELRRAVADAVGGTIFDQLKYENQRDSIEWRTDMFASEPRMQLSQDKARIVLTHKPFDACAAYDQKIIADYKQHFTRFDEFLEFLVMSRFALDRKKCYLWILADTDWGKGFLLGILNKLGIAVSTSMKEIEAMFEGKPVGRAPVEFKRAFALVVDEFKVVKSELKQLQSEITLCPKNELIANVEVFAKLFFSAENVGSLVTSSGVEDQFANRMSIFEESGSLDERVLFKTESPRIP